MWEVRFECKRVLDDLFSHVACLVFTARRRKKRRLYDPTVEAEKPQWLSKDERVGKPSKASTSSSFGVQKKGRPAKSSVSSRASEASSTGGSRRKKKGKARKSGPGAAV